MAADDGIRKLRAHIFNLVQEAQRAKRKWSEDMSSQSPPSVISFLNKAVWPSQAASPTVSPWETFLI